MKVYEGVVAYIHAFLTLTLHGGELSASRIRILCLIKQYDVRTYGGV